MDSLSDDDDSHSVISISSESGSVTSMLSISFSEVEPFVSSDHTLVGSEISDCHWQTEKDAWSARNTSNELDLDSEMLENMPSNASKLIENFRHYQTLPEVIHNLIIFSQQNNRFQFLYGLDPSICTWNHIYNCRHQTDSDNLVEFYFRESIYPLLRLKYLMYYQPSLWLDNPPASKLHFVMRTQSLTKFIHKCFIKSKMIHMSILVCLCSNWLKGLKMMSAITFLWLELMCTFKGTLHQNSWPRCDQSWSRRLWPLATSLLTWYWWVS